MSSKHKDTNVIVVEGNLVKDVEVKNIKEKNLAKFRIASQNGDKDTTFIDCEWWNPNGAVEYLLKGKKVAITGRLMQSNWKDKETGGSRSSVFVAVHTLDLRGTKSNSDSAQIIDTDVTDIETADSFYKELLSNELPF